MFLKVLGYALIAFGIADFALYQFGVTDLTGVSWSPIAAGALGVGLLRLAAKR
jgi:hypothetical protein